MNLLAHDHLCLYAGVYTPREQVQMTEVSETLKKAHDAVVAAEIPEQFHEIAFREAVRLLAPVAQPVITAATPRQSAATAGMAPTKSVGTEDSAPVVSEDEMYERVVMQTGADRAKVEEVFHEDSNVPVVSLPGLRLGKNNAETTRVNAQVLTIARGFGLGENDTSIEVIRNEAIRLKCYDSANFTSHLATLDGYVVTGSGQNRRIRARASGIAAFPALVDRLVGEA